MNLPLLPAVLIGLGVGFLLHNLNIISFTPWALLWPGLIIYVGLSQLRDLKRRPSSGQSSKELVFWLIVTTLGFYLLLPRIGVLVPTLPWKIVWPALLIILGVLKLFPGKQPVFIFKKTGFTKQGPHYKSSFVGEIRKGPSNWVLDDLYVRQAIGSVSLDLTQAIIPEREVELYVSGYVGDVSIYLPPGLDFRAECSLGLGDLTVLEHNESGSQKYIVTETTGYAQAARRLNIQVHWKIGDVRVRQIQ
ncbi:MAG TPA: cell wall-active antibiotics response protein [Firmicutes bacterium]|nr:cell wall-active antibiotics response protein [Bacillota bacterium]